MRCIIYSPHWLRTIPLFVVKSAFYILTLAWGFRRCSFRLVGQCESLYSVERVTEQAPRFFVCIYQHLLIIAILEPMGIFLIRLIMKKNEKNDELQSRREFFKKAAKGALPILGAIALAGAPGVVKAAEEAMDCNYSCSYSCSNSCRGNCYGGCSGSCGGACSYSCQNTCKGSCQGRCSGGCSSMNSF